MFLSLSYLHQFCHEFENGGGDGGVGEPDGDGAEEDGGVGGVEPLEQHHVRSLRVEGKGDAAKVTRQPDQSPLHLCLGGGRGEIGRGTG